MVYGKSTGLGIRLAQNLKLLLSGLVAQVKVLHHLETGNNNWTFLINKH